MRLLLVLLGLTQSLWTAKIVGLDVTIDGHTSTGPISQYWITWGDGTPDVKSRSPISTHHYAKAGVYVVRQQVFDSVARRWYSAGATKAITVTAPTLPPVARVDTVTRVDTLRLPSKPDTIRRVDTVRVGASMQFLLPWGPFVDSSRVGTTMVVHWTTFLGTLRKYEKGYVAYGQDSLPIVKGVPVPVSLDSAVSLLSPKSLSVKVGP